MATYAAILEELIATFPGETITARTMESFLKQLPTYQGKKNAYPGPIWSAIWQTQAEEKIIYDEYPSPTGRVVTLGFPNDSKTEIWARHLEGMRQLRLRKDKAPDAEVAVKQDAVVQQLQAKVDEVQEEITKTTVELMDLHQTIIASRAKSPLFLEYQALVAEHEGLSQLEEIYRAQHKLVENENEPRLNPTHHNLEQILGRGRESTGRKRDYARMRRDGALRKIEKDPQIAGHMKKTGKSTQKLTELSGDLAEAKGKLKAEMHKQQESLLDTIVELDSLAI